MSNSLTSTFVEGGQISAGIVDIGKILLVVILNSKWQLIRLNWQGRYMEEHSV